METSVASERLIKQTAELWRRGHMQTRQPIALGIQDAGPNALAEELDVAVVRFDDDGSFPSDTTTGL